MYKTKTRLEDPETSGKLEDALRSLKLDPGKVSGHMKFQKKESSAGSGNIIIGHIDNVVVNNNIQYSFPIMPSPQYPVMSPYLPYYESPYQQPLYPESGEYIMRQRLAAYVERETLPVLDSPETLLTSFIRLITPAKTEEQKTLWEFYLPACANGLELFCSAGGQRPRMAAYSPSLSALHFVFGEGKSSASPISEYFEAEPPHMRQPLYNKVQELTGKQPLLGSVRIDGLQSGSW